MLPSSLGSYYRYTGSLTTPPCSRVVEWIVFSQPVFLSHQQVREFPPLHPRDAKSAQPQAKTRTSAINLVWKAKVIAAYHYDFAPVFNSRAYKSVSFRSA